MTIGLRISNAWGQAADDLGIRVIAPFSLKLPGGDVLLAEAHILDFGKQGGAIALSEKNRLDNEFRRLNRWCSVLSELYQTYERELFIETLDDWMWFGERGGEPSWYTGTPRT